MEAFRRGKCSEAGTAPDCWFQSCTKPCTQPDTAWLTLRGTYLKSSRCNLLKL